MRYRVHISLTWFDPIYETILRQIHKTAYQPDEFYPGGNTILITSK
jgi:hypothetical protein